MVAGARGFRLSFPVVNGGAFPRKPLSPRGFYATIVEAGPIRQGAFSRV